MYNTCIQYITYLHVQYMYTIHHIPTRTIHVYNTSHTYMYNTCIQYITYLHVQYMYTIHQHHSTKNVCTYILISTCTCTCSLQTLHTCSYAHSTHRERCLVSECSYCTGRVLYHLPCSGCRTARPEGARWRSPQLCRLGQSPWPLPPACRLPAASSSALAPAGGACTLNHSTQHMKTCLFTDIQPFLTITRAHML